MKRRGSIYQNQSNAMFTMADVEAAYFDSAEFADERLEELRKKFKRTPQARNAAALQGTAMTIGERNRVMKRASNRQANVAAGLGPSGQRRGFFRTVKGKKTFVRGGAVVTKRTKKGIVKVVADGGNKGARGLLREGYGKANKFVGSNKLGQRAVNTGYRALSSVVARPGRAGAIAAGIGAAGAGATYLARRMSQDDDY